MGVHAFARGDYLPRLPKGVKEEWLAHGHAMFMREAKPRRCKPTPLPFPGTLVPPRSAGRSPASKGRHPSGNGEQLRAASRPSLWGALGADPTGSCGGAHGPCLGRKAHTGSVWRWGQGGEWPFGQLVQQRDMLQGPLKGEGLGACHAQVQALSHSVADNANEKKCVVCCGAAPSSCSGAGYGEERDGKAP